MADEKKVNPLIAWLTGAREAAGKFGRPLEEPMTKQKRNELYKQRINELRLRFKSKYPTTKVPKYSKDDVVPEFGASQPKKPWYSKGIYDLFG